MDFSKHIKKAEEALRRRNYDFAIEVYQQLLEIDPDVGEARAGLRVAIRKRHEKKGGGRILRAIGGAVPLATAKTLYKAGKLDAASRQLETYLARNPLDESANLLLGNALEEAGHYQSARAVYEYLAEIAPKNPEGLKRAGAMMYKTGDHARALEYYERALEADPRDQDALKARKNLAAETALEARHLTEIRHSRDQIKDKEEAHLLERSQRLHMSEEDLREDLAKLENAFAEAPADVDLMVGMADIHEKLRDPEAALDLVERALSYRKDSYELACRAGDLQSKALKKRIARADKEADQEKASRLELELRQYEVEDYRRRVDIHPSDAALLLQLGKRLMWTERYDEALAQFQRANTDQRVRRESLFYMAQCFQKKDFNDLARQEYLRALEGIGEVDERAKEIMYNLGSIAESEGNAEEARSYYARVYQVDIGYRDVASKMEQFK